MSLRDQGFKFCINPDKTKARWLHPYELAQWHPDWTDVTEWPDERLLAFLMPPPGQQELFAA